MLEENLVGYLLKALDPEEQRQVERAIQDDPETRRRLELLEHALQPLSADQEQPVPPADLRYRVLARVAEDRLQTQPLRLKVPPLSSEGGGRSWWRRADVLAAAVLLMVVGPLVAPAISFARSRFQIGQCQNNLRAFHASLMAYTDLHEGRLPRVDKEPPRNVAGVVVPILYQEGLGQGLNLRCPSNQGPEMPLHSLAELDAAYTSHDGFDNLANQLSGSYAYAMGYQDASGQLHGLRVDTTLMDNDLIPVMADRPAFNQTQGIFVEPTPNSRNHDSKGQNVLYLGGAVRFVTNPRIGAYGDDIYLNQQNRIAAGLFRLDSVLGASDFRPCPTEGQ